MGPQEAPRGLEFFFQPVTRVEPHHADSLSRSHLVVGPPLDSSPREITLQRKVRDLKNPDRVQWTPCPSALNCRLHCSAQVELPRKVGPRELLKHRSCYSLRQRISVCSQRAGAWPSAEKGTRGWLAVHLSPPHPRLRQTRFQSDSLSSSLRVVWSWASASFPTLPRPQGIHVPRSERTTSRRPSSQDCCKDPKQRQ